MFSQAWLGSTAVSAFFPIGCIQWLKLERKSAQTICWYHDRILEIENNNLACYKLSRPVTTCHGLSRRNFESSKVRSGISMTLGPMLLYFSYMASSPKATCHDLSRPVTPICFLIWLLILYIPWLKLHLTRVLPSGNQHKWVISAVKFTDSFMYDGANTPC